MKNKMPFVAQRQHLHNRMLQLTVKTLLIINCQLLILLGAGSCSKDEISGNSIFVDSTAPRTAFDEWLFYNYTSPYNIDVKYKLDYIESDMSYQLAPARVEKAIALIKLIKYLWLEAYDEHAGVDFLRTYVPRVIHLVGSPAYNANGTMMLGAAEGGLKITLYAVNDLDTANVTIAFMNEYYLRTMHHEFAHILHQTKNYPPEFQLITKSGYLGEDWSAHQEWEALQAGFISNYSRKSPDEDFVELIAHYLVNTPQDWERKLMQAGEGKALIKQKIDMVKRYLSSMWNIDLDTLRSIVQERAGNFGKLNLNL
jgi:substrate import-associated zinc metallohydrolase lipoprotein